MVGTEEPAAGGRDELAGADTDADTLGRGELVGGIAVGEAGAAELTGAAASFADLPQPAVSAMVTDNSSTSCRLLDT